MKTATRLTARKTREAPARPTREEVVAAIMTESHCRAGEAVATLTMIERAVAWCRKHPGQPYYIPQRELDLTHHVFAAVVRPRSADVRPGSARALINRHVLEGNELNVLHTARERGGRQHCTIDVTINVV